MAVNETQLSIRISRYINTKYPDIIYHFDYGSGLKMSKRQAVRQKILNKKRGYPDLFISKTNSKYSGLFIEVKIETPFKKDGYLKAGKHLEEQNEMLENLRKQKYFAEFGTGFEECKAIIDNYINIK